MHKNKLKMAERLNVRQDTIKLLEENRGKTFSDINLMNFFSGQFPKAIEIKTKINTLDQMYKFLHSKENHKK